MKQILTVISLLAAVIASAAESQVPNWKNLDVYSVNARTQRTELIFWSSWEDALSKDFEQSSFYKDLNGTWKFRYHDTQEDMDPAIG